MKGMRDCIALPPIVLTGSVPAFQVLDGAPGDGATNTLGKEAYRRGDRLFPSHGDRNISCAWQAANLLWRFKPWSRETGMDRAADNHYPTSEPSDIAARDVASIAADDCVLFLWATAPMLPQAIDVMRAWGFAYKSHFVWAKDRLGTGYWNRNKHE